METLDSQANTQRISVMKVLTSFVLHSLNTHVTSSFGSVVG